MITCPKCGTENPDRNIRCKKCLTKIREWKRYEKILNVCALSLLGLALLALLLQPALTQMQIDRQREHQRARDEIEIDKEYQARIRREAEEQKSAGSAPRADMTTEYTPRPEDDPTVKDDPTIKDEPTASSGHLAYSPSKTEDLPDYADDNFRAWLKTFQKRTESSGGRIRGRVINDSNRMFGYVAIKFSLYDSSGNLIGSTMSNMNDLGSGQTWHYEAVVLQDEAESAEISSITAF